MGVLAVLVLLVFIFVLVILASSIKIVPQAYAYVVERLGAYQSTWSVGFHIKIPVFDKVARKINLKEQVVDCGKSDYGDREPDRNNTSKHHW